MIIYKGTSVGSTTSILDEVVRWYTLEEGVEAMRRMGCPQSRIDLFVKHATAEVQVYRVQEESPG